MSSLPPTPESTNVFWSAASLFDKMFNQLDVISGKLDTKADKSDIDRMHARIDAHTAEDRQNFDALTNQITAIRTERIADQTATGAVSRFKTRAWGGLIGLSGVASTVALLISVLH